jgi:hypothetical protein
MKNLIFILTTGFIAFAASAHEIKGTLILKGTAKTKINLNGLEVRCHVKVDDVKNNLVEDTFGNPAYRVWTIVELSGGTTEQRVSEKLPLRFTNIHPTATGTIVLDDQYRGENVPSASMKIDERGRIRSVTFPLNGKSVSCTF